MAPDLLRWPILGAWLRWRHARTSAQLVLLAVALLVVLHGLFGPQLAPANLATVLTWVHYRGLLIVALLAAGNVFCTACPLVLVRDAGRRLRTPRLAWPRRLRGKWVAVALVAAVLFAYELFDLWALPRATAWLVLGYFGAALAVDLLFRGASFCKYVCPIGQFNFVASTVSPLELRIRRPETCSACTTADCIRGRRAAAAPHRVVQRGCELGLFLPAKVGNLDCTFCLDCVQACPHENVAVATRVPGLELVEMRRRSGVGWIGRRTDLAALVLVFVFGALVNAFAMVAPASALQRWIATALGVSAEAPVLAGLFVLALGLAPAVIAGGAGAMTARLTGEAWSACLPTLRRYAHALVPLGAGIWLAHYGFHLLTGVFTVVPVAQSAAIDATGWAALGAPLWGWTGMRPGAVLPLQLGVVLLGASGSLGLAYLVADRDHPLHPWRAALPWAGVVLLLAAAAAWTLMQPMEMRAVGVG